MLEFISEKNPSLHKGPPQKEAGRVFDNMDKKQLKNSFGESTRKFYTQAIDFSPYPYTAEKIEKVAKIIYSLRDEMEKHDNFTAMKEAHSKRFPEEYENQSAQNLLRSYAIKAFSFHENINIDLNKDGMMLNLFQDVNRVIAEKEAGQRDIKTSLYDAVIEDVKTKMLKGQFLNSKPEHLASTLNNIISLRQYKILDRTKSITAILSGIKSKEENERNAYIQAFQNLDKNELTTREGKSFLKAFNAALKKDLNPNIKKNNIKINIPQFIKNLLHKKDDKELTKLTAASIENKTLSTTTTNDLSASKKDIGEAKYKKLKTEWEKIKIQKDISSRQLQDNIKTFHQQANEFLSNGSFEPKYKTEVNTMVTQMQSKIRDITLASHRDAASKIQSSGVSSMLEKIQTPENKNSSKNPNADRALPPTPTPTLTFKPPGSHG